jgi:hypothetical protein
MFEKLLQEIETLAKAEGAGGEGGAGAAGGEGGEGAAAAAAAAAGGEGGAGKGGEGADDPLAKAMKATDADGNEVDVVDATELLKSMAADVAEMKGSYSTDKGNLAKALTVMHGLFKSQGELIKAQASKIAELTETVTAMGSTGRGRRAVVSVTGKAEMDAAATELTKAHGGAGAVEMTPKEFLAKAMDKFNAGKLSGGDVQLAETYINSGRGIPQELIDRVVKD